MNIISVDHFRSDFFPDHEAAEYAVLVTDRWQGRGLGGRITDYCLEIARSRGLRPLTAITTPDNSRALNLVRSRVFDIAKGPEEGVATIRKELA